MAHYSAQVQTATSADRAETQGMLNAIASGGNVKTAAMSAVEPLIREKIRESGVTRRIFQLRRYTNEELNEQLYTNKPVVILNREQDADVGAVVSTFEGVPSPRPIRGNKVPLYFGKLMSDRLQSNELDLMTYRYDIKKLFTDNALVGFGDKEDEHFLTKLNEAVDTDATQVIEISSRISVEGIIEGEKAMLLRKRPTAMLVTTERTWIDMVYHDAQNIGPDLRKQVLADPINFNPTKYKVVLTNKSEIFTDGEVWMLPPEDFFGKFGCLKDITMHIREDSGVVRWHYYAYEGWCIAQPRSVQLIRFGVAPR